MQNLTDSSFQNEVLEGGGVVLVDFWAPWCGPCKMVGPALEEIAKEKGDKLKVAKVNVDENPGLASSYQVLSIPTMLIFKEGKKVDGFSGAMSKGDIEKKLEQWIQ